MFRFVMTNIGRGLKIIDALDAQMSELEFQSPGSQYEMPARIKTDVAIELRQSEIPGAGRGLFVMQNVKAGGLIFEVPNLVYSTIAADCLKTTCDNCFAHKSKCGKTDPRPDLSFFACEDCKVTHYCSPQCMKIAWAAYHQFECPTLAKMLAFEPGWEDKANLRSEEFRTIIRILCLQAAGKIPDKEWTEFMSLLPRPPGPDGLPCSVTGLPEMLALIEKYEVTKLDAEDVTEFIRRYCNNRCFIQLWTPYHRPPDNTNRYRAFEIPVGECLDPFYAMINHCCDPNATWLSEGRTLQVRAERDITAGEELTICYVWSEPVDDRQTKLASWIGKCTCSICTNPQPEPVGPLRELLTNLVTARRGAATPNQARSISIEFAVGEMERAGLGLSAWPMKKLHVQLFRCYVRQCDGPNMLKTWLKLYFFIEPAMIPHECLGNRSRSLGVLAYLLDLEDPAYQSFSPYPQEVVRLVFWLHYQMRVKLLHLIRQCHSADSYRLRVEEELYEEDFGDLERDAGAMVVRDERDFVPYTESVESKWGFVKDMNELLAWAGLGKVTEKQLLSMRGE